MRNISLRLQNNKNKFYLTLLLATASLISFVLAATQHFISDSRNYQFLLFNLFLAWIPYLAAGVAYLSMANKITFFLIMPVSTLAWLVFFPNAPYLLTDFQHIAATTQDSLLWYDVIVLVWVAWTGLLLGMGSLYLMQEIITRVFNKTMGWFFVIGATILSSIGVYLGRFLRWNSWDILQDPLPIAKDMAGIVRHPFSNLPTYVFTILFTLLILFMYVTFHVFGNLMREYKESTEEAEAPTSSPVK